MAVASNFDVVMPQMGSSVTEGTISRWLKQVGDTVQADETIVEISTDKVDTEVPSPAAGVIMELLVAEGITVDVGTPIAVLSTDLTATPVAAAPTTTPIVAAVPEPLVTALVSAESAPVAAVAAPVTQLPGDGEGRAFVSPVVARMVAEHQLTLSEIAGTGRGGRVTKADVENFLAARASGGGYAAPLAEPTAVAVTPTAPATPAAPAAPAPAVAGASAAAGEEIYSFSRVRQVTAKHMRESIETAAHVTQVWEVDLGRVTDIRTRLKPKFKNDYGVNLSFLPFIMPQPHPCSRRRDLGRLQRIECITVLTALHVAVAASARARLAHDLEGRGAAPPALADIRATSLFADGDEPMLAHDARHFVKARTRTRRAHTHPIGTRLGFRPPRHIRLPEPRRAHHPGPRYPSHACHRATR